MSENEFPQVAVDGNTTTLANKRERTGWYFYDWANSAFSTTVITVFLGRDVSRENESLG